MRQLRDDFDFEPAKSSNLYCGSVKYLTGASARRMARSYRASKPAQPEINFRRSGCAMRSLLLTRHTSAPSIYRHFVALGSDDVGGCGGGCRPGNHSSTE